jgi:hypothetical protein
MKGQQLLRVCNQQKKIALPVLYRFGLRNSPKEYFLIQKLLIPESNALDSNILRLGILDSQRIRFNFSKPGCNS